MSVLIEQWKQVRIAEGVHPVPCRTRKLSPPAPMVLRFASRESRSSPASLFFCTHDPVAAEGLFRRRFFCVSEPRIFYPRPHYGFFTSSGVRVLFSGGVFYVPHCRCSGLQQKKAPSRRNTEETELFICGRECQGRFTCRLLDCVSSIQAAGVLQKIFHAAAERTRQPVDRLRLGLVDLVDALFIFVCMRSALFFPSPAGDSGRVWNERGSRCL